MTFLLNGESVDPAGTAPHRSLLDFIRARGLTGAKEGCAEGECGACMVLLVRPHGADASRFVAINACLLPAALAAGHEVWTVEALAEEGRLSEVQQQLVAHGGSQCGYCTPGFVVSLFAEHHRPGRSGDCDLHALAGNLCRCTGYRPIRDAALALGPGPAPDSPLRQRLARPAPVPAPFDEGAFARPASLAECLAMLAAAPEARLVSGATDLQVEVNLRGRRFPRLVSTEAIPELHEFRETPSETVIGAALPLADLASVWRTAPPVFREWITLFASPPIRQRATLGGNLATASPIGDSAPLLLALDARLRLAGPSGERFIPLRDFFTGYRQTVLGPGELIVAIHLPHPLPLHARFFKVAKRPLDDISSLAACFALDWEEDDTISRARFAFGGVAATPVRVEAAERAVLGLPWDESTLRRALAIFAETLHPISDHRASARYRLAMAQSLLEKFLAERSAHP